MSYLVFARKFRPQSFNEIVGQEPITTTLKNAIAKGRIAQSFLFTGSRGVGKTSTARILAKALNCEKGPAPEPCNQCAICEEITHGSSLDILEIDGASNRGIEDIRSLRENVKFKPAHGRFKVYIIDEVHQITADGFNALLKTLEEPPEHVKFIFATTEAHKVPLTILSRCQRFNFKRIPTQEIAEKLAEIAKKEKIKPKGASLFLIAKAAEGSLRDAEGMLDQLASFSDGAIEEEDVAFSLGLTKDDIYFSLLQAFKDREAENVLDTIHKTAESGKDLTQFARGLLEVFRDLLIAQVSGTKGELIEGTEEYKNGLEKLKSAFSREELLFSLTLLQGLVRELRWSAVPKFLIETCLLKIVYRADLKPIDEMIRELKNLGPKLSTPAPAASEPKKKAVGGSNYKPPVPNDNDGPEGAVAVSKVRDKTKTNTHSNPNVSFADIERVWPELVERVKAAKMSCGTYLSESSPVDVVDGFAVFGFPKEFKFHKEAIEKQDNRGLVRDTLVSLLGCEIGVSFVVTETEKLVETKAAEPTTLESEIIISALHLFEGSKVIRRDP